MKKNTILYFICLALFSCPLIGWGQEIPATTQQQLENQTDINQGEPADDSYLQSLDEFSRHKLNLNIAGAGQLKRQILLTGLQIENIIAYRESFGQFTSIYELQAVPSLDIATIRKILPYVSVSIPLDLKTEWSKRFTAGEHSLLIRIAQILERSKGFLADSTRSGYLGSPQKILLRYKYVDKDLLQFGLLADKDAGEQLFKGGQRYGFDFYSFHFYARHLGIIKVLALGDFTVNMGQGLISWQTLAFNKSVSVLSMKRQASVLLPYNSSGEYDFHRGAGLTLQKGNWEATLFASFRKLSAHFVDDSVTQEDYISSFQTSGYHRTPAEIADRNDLSQISFGSNLSMHFKKGHAGMNWVGYQFSLPVQKRNEPYNLYALSGKRWENTSLEFDYTWKNMHLFGEEAVDKNLRAAFLNGLLISVDPRVDLSFLQRTISPKFQSVYGYAFTENTYPTNETGFYIGISVRPFDAWRLDAYADIFKFPWLKYGVDAPSHGSDYLAQLTFTPNKQFEIYNRFSNLTKQANQSGNSTADNFLVTISKQDWREQLTYRISRTFLIRTRFDMLWYDKHELDAEKGFLGFIDVLCHPPFFLLSCNVRLQYFETGGYHSRLYAYEDDVLYSYSVPPSYGKGFRYYLNIRYDLSKKITAWIRCAETIYPGQKIIGSGLDEIRGNHKTELKLEARYLF